MIKLVSLKVIYKCVYYCVLHIVQFGGSALLARNVILAFKNAAQTHIVQNCKWVASSFAHKLGWKL